MTKKNETNEMRAITSEKMAKEFVFQFEMNTQDVAAESEVRERA